VKVDQSRLDREQGTGPRLSIRSLRPYFHLKLTFANAISRLVPVFVSSVVRVPLYRLAGFKIGPGCSIFGNLSLISGLPGFYDRLILGRDVIVAHSVTVNCDAPVRIGDQVCISPHVLIYTASHRIGPESRRQGDVVIEPVTIEDGAWIALGAIILPGVTVGRGSIVAAGAVVFQDVPPNSYVKGNPARVINRLPERAVNPRAWPKRSPGAAEFKPPNRSTVTDDSVDHRLDSPEVSGVRGRE
jgi:acetyltransferase-like isoleucine patch superfamily enzyme